MAWARLDDDYFTHRKTARLSKDAKLLDLAGITFSARELRDGVLSDQDVRIVAAQVDVRNIDECLVELSGVERWSQFDGGWEIHDYLVYNPSRLEILRDRAASAERARASRDRRNGVSNGARARAPVPVPYPGNVPLTPDPAYVPRAPARAREIDQSRLCSACSTTLPRRRPAHGLCVDCHGKALLAARDADVDVTHISLGDLTEFAIRARAAS